MGIPSLDPKELTDYRVYSAGLDDPSKGLSLPWYTGALEAIPQGVVSGVAAVGRAFGAAAVGSAKAEFWERQAMSPWWDPDLAAQVQAADIKPVANAAWDAMDAWAAPKESSGFAQTVQGVARGITIVGMGSFVGGPQMGAALLGGSEGYGTYYSNVQQGVDPTTAAQAGLVVGATSWLGAALPFSVAKGAASDLLGMANAARSSGRQTLARFYEEAARGAEVLGSSASRRVATGVVVNDLMGIGSRWATGEVLEHGGYHELAKQYDALDASALVADTVLGAAFGGWGEVAGKAKVDQYDRPGPLEIDAALDVTRRAQESHGTVGVPTDPAAIAIDAELRARATDAMVKGNDFSATPEEADYLVNHTLLSPNRAAEMASFQKALFDEFGVRPMDIEPNAKKIYSATGDVLREVAPPMEIKTEGARAEIDPIHKETLAQIAANNPDLDVVLPDGTSVKAGEAASVIEAKLAKDLELSDLFEAAMACARRG